MSTHRRQVPFNGRHHTSLGFASIKEQGEIERRLNEMKSTKEPLIGNGNIDSLKRAGRAALEAWQRPNPDNIPPEQILVFTPPQDLQRLMGDLKGYVEIKDEKTPIATVFYCPDRILVVPKDLEEPWIGPIVGQFVDLPSLEEVQAA